MRTRVKVDYGHYGSIALYAGVVVVALLLVFILVFVEQLRIPATLLLVLDILVGVCILMLSKVRATIVNHVVAKGEVKAGYRVLDVGTGRGFLAIEVAKMVPGCEVVGIDLWELPAKDQVHKGFVVGNTKRNAESNALVEGVADRVTFLQCDARSMPFASDSFDVVMSSAALHQMMHFGKNGHAVLDEICRVMKLGGRFVDADALIGKGMLEYLVKLGFVELQVNRLIKVGPFAVLKLLSCTKPSRPVHQRDSDSSTNPLVTGIEPTLEHRAARAATLLLGGILG